MAPFLIATVADFFIATTTPVRTPVAVRTVAGLPEVANLSAGAGSDGTVEVNWGAYAPWGVLYYELYRDSGDGSLELWLTPVERQYSFKGASGASYTFAVRAVDLLGQRSLLSAPVSVTVPRYAGSTGGGGGGGYTPPARRVEKWIVPGSVTVAELAGRARVEVSAKAAKGENARLVLEEVEGSRAASAGMTAVGPVVDIRLVGGELAGKITVTLYFDRSKLPEGCDPAIFCCDEKAGRWQKVGGTADLTKGTVTAELDHLTLFAVFAVPKEVAKPAAFADLAGHWAEKVVLELAGKGLVYGYPDGTFKPDNEITRAEVTAVLARALKLAPGKEEDLKFADGAVVPAWAKGAVAAAAVEGLVKGYPQPDGSVTFEPHRPVSRGEVVALAIRVLERKAGLVIPARLEFNDAGAIPDWARASVGAAVASGIVVGYPDGTFQPERPVTRAEAAAVVYRLLNAL